VSAPLATVNVSFVRVIADVISTPPSFAARSVKVDVPYVSDLLPEFWNVTFNSCVLFVTFVAWLLVKASVWNATVRLLTEFALSCVDAVPLRLRVADVPETRVIDAERPAGTLVTKTFEPRVRLAAYVSFARVMVSELLIVPLFATASVNVVAEYVRDPAPAGTLSAKSITKSALL
jgi:hypothetical protein